MTEQDLEQLLERVREHAESNVADELEALEEQVSELKAENEELHEAKEALETELEKTTHGTLQLASELEQQYQYLFDNTTDAIVAVAFEEGEPIIREVNPAFEETFGYDSETVIDEALADVLAPPGRGSEVAEHTERVRAGEHITTEVQRTTTTGPREFLLRGIPIEKEGIVDMAYAVYTDITNRKLREQQLQVLNRVLRHNLRNEMNVIQGRAANLVDDLTDPDAQAEAHEIVTTATQLVKLSQKAEQVKRLTQRSGHPGSIDVARCVEKVVETIQETYPEADIETQLPESAIARGTEQLTTALRELCENAIEHSDASSPSVTMRVLKRGDPVDRVEISVIDTGPGIPEEERTVIRERQETPLQHGNGLGLWIVTWIVTRLGGEVEIADNDPRGSVVTISLSAATDV